MFTSCGSPWLLRVLDTLYDHSERYRMLTIQAGARDVHREHDDIYEATLRRDKKAALDALRRHLEGTVELLEAKATSP
jgi:DNA-binding GntR family transcriptional regulator